MEASCCCCCGCVAVDDQGFAFWRYTVGSLPERSVHPSVWKQTMLDFDIYYHHNGKISLVAKRLPHRRFVGQGSL